MLSLKNIKSRGFYILFLVSLRDLIHSQKKRQVGQTPVRYGQAPCHYQQGRLSNVFLQSVLSGNLQTLHLDIAAVLWGTPNYR